MKKFADILGPLGILESKIDPEKPISGISFRAESLRPGDVYFAIAGTKFDGHSVLAEAVKRGASAVVVEKEAEYALYENAVRVASTRESLALASAAWFGEPSGKLQLVGATGTNGKTTTCYLLRSAWKHLNLKTGIIGTVETCIGDQVLAAKLTTPGPYELQSLFAQMVNAQVTHVAMEVSSIALDQFRTAGTEFKVALFTNLTQDHLDYHGDFETYFNAKLKLFRDYGVPTAVINLDDEWARRILVQGKSRSLLTFSLKDPSADFFAEGIQLSRHGIKAVVKTPAGTFPFHSSLIGKHNLQNLLGALAALHSGGVPMRSAVEALSQAQGAPGRLERVMEGAEYPSVFVDYAHTADALHNVLTSLRVLQDHEGRGRLITVFGCGGDRDRTKRPKMAHEASLLSDLAVMTSDNPRTEDPEKILDEVALGLVPGKGTHREVNRKAAIEWVLRQAAPEDTIVIAGKGHETYQIIGTQEFPFDDRQVVRDYYSKNSA